MATNPNRRLIMRRTPFRHIAGVVLLLTSVVPQASAQGTREETGGAVRSQVRTPDGVQLAVYEHGPAGAQSIVFIHAFSQGSHTWEAQVEALSRDFHVVTYDMRGHGASDRPLDPAQYTDVERWADELAAVLQATNARNPVLVGWSYGGYVISDYVRKYGQDQLGGLVFVGSNTKNGTDQAMAFLADEVLAIFGDVLSPEPLAGIDGTAALVTLFTTPGSREWTRAFGSAMTVPAVIRLAMFSRVLDNDDVLAQIRVPTLVVHGTADRVVRFSAGEHTAATVRGATLLGYEGAGHAPHIDEAGRFNRDVGEFVRSVARTAGGRR
jgi:non-heme chloroperoxidase